MSNPNNEELQGGTVDRPNPMTAATPATALNSNTLEKLKAGKRRARIIIGILSTAATTAMVIPVPAAMPWNFIASAALFTAAVGVAYFTNSMSAEELEALVTKAGGAATAAATSQKKKDGAP